jgi:hypothetical protein
MNLHFEERISGIMLHPDIDVDSGIVLPLAVAIALEEERLDDAFRTTPSKFG